MSKLSQLRSSDPVQFTRVVTGVAADLRDVAARDSGMRSKMLTALASRLDDIANGGAIGQVGAPADVPASRSARGPVTSPAAAAQAYRANAALPTAAAEGARAAISQVLDDLDAALKTTTSTEPRQAMDR